MNVTPNEWPDLPIVPLPPSPRGPILLSLMIVYLTPSLPLLAPLWLRSFLHLLHSFKTSSLPSQMREKKNWKWYSALLSGWMDGCFFDCFFFSWAGTTQLWGAVMAFSEVWQGGSSCCIVLIADWGGGGNVISDWSVARVGWKFDVSRPLGISQCVCVWVGGWFVCVLTGEERRKTTSLMCQFCTAAIYRTRTIVCVVFVLFLCKCAFCFLPETSCHSSTVSLPEASLDVLVSDLAILPHHLITLLALKETEFLQPLLSVYQLPFFFFPHWGSDPAGVRPSRRLNECPEMLCFIPTGAAKKTKKNICWDGRELHALFEILSAHSRDRPLLYKRWKGSRVVCNLRLADIIRCDLIW